MNFHNKSIDETLKAVGGDINVGLSAAEAEKRLAANGKNELVEGKKRPLILKFLDQFKDVMIIVLLAAAVISAIITLVEAKEGKDYLELIDSGLILAIVIVNAVIGLAQEEKAEAALDALKNMNKPFCKVIRGGTIEKIHSDELVVGDTVILEAGDIVPADMRLFESASLKIEEAALTGESVPSEKDTELISEEETPLGDRKNMAFSSGVVSYGRGKGVVVATGMDTEVGKIATMLAANESEQTPLQHQLSKTAKVLSVMVLSIAAVIFVAAILRAVIGIVNPDIKTAMIDSFMTAVAIAVAAIPEGLPAVVTIVLALGVQRMSERRAIVRNLPAVETLGCCEVICSDKTGTLTLNQMTVKKTFTLKGGIALAEDGAKIENNNLTADAEGLLVTGMVLCNDTVTGSEKLVGDPTETALVQYAIDKGLDIEAFKISYPRVDELPFDSIRKLMTTVNENGGKKLAYIKGAPDILISKCKYVMDGSQVRDITENDVKKIKDANSAMAFNALRVLGVAVNKNLEGDLESDMIFTGLVGMIDPARPEVKGAVATCRKAGMRAIMITGDHIDTASAIAKEIGILKKGDLVITGADLDKLSDEEFYKNLSRYRVFARVSPENKVRIVKAFKKFNIIVAMTGDGVNDAPSIKAADIGIGMGITGTDVSKGAADMVLADDNFATIIAAVEEGRKVYANITKAVRFLLSANIAEVLCLFIATVFMGVSFLTPVMILWVNLVTDSLPALALGREKAEPDIMLFAPRKTDESMFAGRTGRDILVQGAMQTVLVMVSFCLGYYVMPDTSGVHGVGVTMAFVTLAMVQLFHAYNTRNEYHTLFKKDLFSNVLMNISFVIGAGLVVVAAFIDVWTGIPIFGTASLTASEWLVAIGCSVAILPMVEIQKAIERAVKKKASVEENAEAYDGVERKISAVLGQPVTKD
jgi:plasma-membrane calcium-translocating P-type ATPase